MNDFTKEELEDLHYAIRFFWKNRSVYDLPSDTEDGTNSHDLMEKIQSMIENYCEHDWHAMCDNYDPCDPECMVCQKCHIALKEFK